MAELYKSVIDLMKTARGNRAIQDCLCDITDFQQIVDDTPTADVVEVVRCEECEHSREIDRSKSPERYFNSHCIVCECEKVVGDEPMIYPKTHFCSYGKKE